MARGADIDLAELPVFLKIEPKLGGSAEGFASMAAIWADMPRSEMTSWEGEAGRV